MPMVWNAQTDAQLLVAIISVYDVKVSGEKLKEVAAIMGEDCTPKALTHRISKLKAMAKAPPGEEGDEEKGGKKAAAKGKGKGGKGAKKADTPVEEGDDEETKPKQAGGKRKNAEAEEGEEGEAKKVKVEGSEEGGDEF